MELIGALLSVLTACLGIIGWFVKKYMESMEKDVRQLRVDFSALKQDTLWLIKSNKEIQSSSVHNTKGIQTSIGAMSAKIDTIKSNSDHIDDKLKSHEKHLENYGQVIRVLINKKS